MELKSENLHCATPFAPFNGTVSVPYRTMSPATTGTSVLGVTFEGGVIIAADLLGSYGAMARFRNCPRIMKINETTMLGAGGDYADYQFLASIIDQKIIDEESLNDGFHLSAKSLYSWLTRVLYNRRSKFNPLWSTYIVGGLEDGVPFLGHIDKIGTAYQDKSIATGYGAYFATPLMRELYENKETLPSEQEARDMIVRCLRILYYRDARSFQKYQLATVNADGAKIEGPLEVESNWDIAQYVQGYE